jgi:hypothetical protein
VRASRARAEAYFTRKSEDTAGKRRIGSPRPDTTNTYAHPSTCRARLRKLDSSGTRLVPIALRSLRAVCMHRQRRSCRRGWIATACAAGERATPVVQTLRLVIVLAQELRTLTDQRLLPSELTTQQAALLTMIETAGHAPAMTQAARALSSAPFVSAAWRYVTPLTRTGIL